MITDEQAAEIQKSRTAPRVTKESIEAKIAKTEFSVDAGTTLTIAVITLQNGFTVVGTAACAAPENFNKDLGEKYAYDDAFKKIWSLEGYLLRENIWQQAQPAEAPKETGADDGHTCCADPDQKEAA